MHLLLTFLLSGWKINVEMTILVCNEQTDVNLWTRWCIFCLVFFYQDGNAEMAIWSVKSRQMLICGQNSAKQCIFGFVSFTMVECWNGNLVCKEQTNVDKTVQFWLCFFYQSGNVEMAILSVEQINSNTWT